MNGNDMASTPTLFDARTDDRVRKHTASSVNARIDRLSHATLAESVNGGRDAMIARLKQLDREWDVDRALMLNFAVIGTLTHELGRRHHRNWTYLLRAQLAFLFMHAVAGWCPPLPVLRRLGFRTSKEIADDRTALLEHLRAAPVAS
jgi:hypothetical protein